MSQARGGVRFADPSMRVATLVNPNARKGEFLARWPDVRARIADAIGIPAENLETIYSSQQEHGASLVRNALKEGVRRIIAVGGDGTVTEAVQGFFEAGGVKPVAEDAVLAVYPAGRGNDFFRTVRRAKVGLDFVDQEKAALALFARGESSALDLLRFEFFAGESLVDSRVAINLASFGLSGAIVGNVVNPQHFLNRGAIARSSLVYLLHTALELRRFRSEKLVVRGRGPGGPVEWEGRMTEGAVLNSRFNAGGAQWLQGTTPEDGTFEVVVLAPGTHFDLLRLVPRLVTGDWRGSAGAHVFRGLTEVELDRREIAPDAGPWIEVDGELLERREVTRARVTLLPGVIKVWTKCR